MQPIYRALFVAGSFVWSAASLADNNWSIGVGAAHTDNAARTAILELSDTIVAVGGSVDIKQEGSRAAFTLSGNGNWLNYLDDTFDDEFVGRATAKLDLGLWPERIHWVIEDTFGQITTDPLQAATPFNRQNVNVLSTGPELRLRLGSRTELQLSGRLRESNYEGALTDDSGLFGQFALIRQSSASVGWSLVGDASRIEFDVPGDPGYDLQNLFLRLRAQGSRQTLRVDIGASRLNDQGRSDTNPLVRLDWNRSLTPSWTLLVTAATEFRDNTDRFLGHGGHPFIPGTSDIQRSMSTAQVDHGRIGLEFRRPRTELGLGVTFSREDFQRAPTLDREDKGIYASARRRFSEKLSGQIDLSYLDRDFDGRSESDDTVRFGASFDWRLGRSLFATLGYRSEHRSADRSLFDYDENIVYINFAYRSGEDSGRTAFIF